MESVCHYCYLNFVNVDLIFITLIIGFLPRRVLLKGVLLQICYFDLGTFTPLVLLLPLMTTFFSFYIVFLSVMRYFRLVRG